MGNSTITDVTFRLNFETLIKHIQINVKKELSSFPFMNMFMPTDMLKGHCHGILASFYNAEIHSCVNGNPKLMMQFCYMYLGLCHYT